MDDQPSEQDRKLEQAEKALLEDESLRRTLRELDQASKRKKGEPEDDE
jgi:hypothetical protein